MRSRKTILGLSRKYLSTATIPSSASITSWPALSRIRLRILRAIPESSTMRIFAIRGLLNRFSQLLQWNRPGGEPRFDDCPRHAEHSAAFLGFGEHNPAV